MKKRDYRGMPENDIRAPRTAQNTEDMNRQRPRVGNRMNIDGFEAVNGGYEAEERRMYGTVSDIGYGNNGSYGRDGFGSREERASSGVNHAQTPKGAGSTADRGIRRDDRQRLNGGADNGKKPKKKRKIGILTNWQLILLSTAIFLLLIFYIDGSNMQYKNSLDAKLHELNLRRDSLREQITRDSSIIMKLKTDDKFLERYARENYYMKQEDEDLFVVK